MMGEPNDQDLKAAHEVVNSVSLRNGLADLVRAIAADRATVRAETWKEAIAVVRQVQEGFVSNGGRSARDREQQRRQSIYTRGLDDARGALEAAAGSKTEVFSREDEQKNSGR